MASRGRTKVRAADVCGAYKGLARAGDASHRLGGLLPGRRLLQCPLHLLRLARLTLVLAMMTFRFWMESHTPYDSPYEPSLGEDPRQEEEEEEEVDPDPTLPTVDEEDEEVDR